MKVPDNNDTLSAISRTKKNTAGKRKQKLFRNGTLNVAADDFNYRNNKTKFVKRRLPVNASLLRACT